MAPLIGWGELRESGKPLGSVRYRIVHRQGTVWGDSSALTRAAGGQQVLLALSEGPPVRVKLRLAVRGMASVQIL